uniref:G_PROTEIN_RECEP_F1_2 domain-containing protein n=1 Tax=Syphacia muris TaxID=451379 RepID=A0A0N5A936_9BILA
MNLTESERNELLDKNLELQWHYLILSVVPIVCIVGNCMVIAAVWTTRSLQTPTNYLLVSLAVADLLVGTLAMPFSIYLSVNSLHWHLGIVLCYIYNGLDVGCSTCSIIHLVLISIDRLVAATKPAEYKTLKHKKRVYYGIFFAWVSCFALSLPLSAGFMTQTKEFLKAEHHCNLYNPVYMFCSSIFAFFLPCLIMIVTYGYIFYSLRRRLQAIQLQEMAGGHFLSFGADVGNITTSAIQTAIGVSPKKTKMISWEKPLLKKIEETAAEHASSLNDSEREQLQTILEAVQPSSSEADFNQLEQDLDRPPSVLLDAVTLPQENLSASKSMASSAVALAVPRPAYLKRVGRRFSESVKSLSPCGVRCEYLDSGNGQAQRRFSYQPTSMKRNSRDIEKTRSQNRLAPDVNRKMRRLSEMISEWERPSRSSLSQMYSYARRESVYIARKKLAGIKDWALDLLAKLKLKKGMAIRREARATKLVAAVMVVFLMCWLPFFTLNMVKVYKLFYNSWPEHLEIWFHWATALGYLNSSLNFFIYSAINQKFRSSFHRLIRHRRSKRNKTRWMMPPPKRSQQFYSNQFGCSPLNKLKKNPFHRKNSPNPVNRTNLSQNKPEIIIQEVSNSINPVSISCGGDTTIR